MNRNLEWMQRNCGDQYRWIIVDNSGEFSLASDSGDGITIQCGPKAPHDTEQNDGKKRLASLHHAQAINQALQAVTTPFALVLDPDFMVLQPSRITDMLQYLQAKNLAMLGVPWHPRWLYHTRSLPAPQFTLINRQIFENLEIDYSPDYRELPPRKAPMALRVVHRMPILKRYSLPVLRSQIGRGGDTGSLLQDLLRQNDLKFETMTPVFQPLRCFNSRPDYIGKVPGIETAGTLLGRCVDALLPDSWRLIPSDKRSWTPHPFAQHGLPDFYDRGWEEFYWKDRPFGIHLRSFPKRASGTQQPDLEAEYQRAIDAMTTILHSPDRKRLLTR